MFSLISTKFFKLFIWKLFDCKVFELYKIRNLRTYFLDFKIFDFLFKAHKLSGMDSILEVKLVDMVYIL